MNKILTSSEAVVEDGTEREHLRGPDLHPPKSPTEPTTMLNTTKSMLLIVTTHVRLSLTDVDETFT